MTEPREIELKLELDPSSAEDFAREAPSRLGGPGEVARRLHSTYYDTRKLGLKRRGLSLRLRTDGDRRVQTLKARQDTGILDRAEWESETSGDRPDPKSFRSGEPRRILEARGGLGPVFETNVERTVWTVREGSSAIEVALDSGTVTSGAAAASIAEVELELKQGSVGDLFSLARRLAEAGQLRLGVRSKSERGYALLDGAGPAAMKAEPIELRRDMGAGAAFQAIARACLRHFRLNEPGMLERRDVDALHQARVAMRRLRSALSLFRDLVADGEVERLKDELRSLSTLLGEARNLDVYRASVIAPEGEREPAVPGARDYADRIAADRETAYDRVAERLGSAEFRVFTLDLSGWIESGPWLTRQENAAACEQGVWAFASAQLERRRRTVKKKGRNLDEIDPDARHEVRIAAKKLRYASEFFGSLVRGGKAKRRHAKFVARLETLQDRLGELNDIRIGHDLAEHVLPAPAEDADRMTAGLFAAGHAAGEQDEKEAELLRAALAAHSEFVKAEPFWR